MHNKQKSAMGLPKACLHTTTTKTISLLTFPQEKGQWTSTRREGGPRSEDSIRSKHQLLTTIRSQ